MLSIVVSALLWICMAPYFLTRWVDKEGALERTFVLIGTVMTGCRNRYVLDKVCRIHAPTY